MADRTRIDWDNLDPLPRKRKDGMDRERLAEQKFNRQRAKHKGRNHLHNWKRRQMQKEAAVVGKQKQARAKSKTASFLDAVRAYWRGDSEEHP